MLFTKITIPLYIQMGIKPNHRNYKPKQLLAIDTETYRGKPITYQTHDGETTVFDWATEKNITKKFCTWLDRWIRTTKQSVIYFHNIEFDAVSLFYPHKENFINSEFKLSVHGWDFEFKFISSKFFTGTKGNQSFIAIDTGSFFYGSLQNLANTFELPHRKLERPKKLGEVKYNKTNKKFIEYSKQDAVVQWELAKVVDDMHEEFDIKQSISIANMAQHIFKHKFVKDTILFPPDACVKLAQESYHGGKNAIYTDPGIYKQVYSLDINSAYPYAMSLFPDFAHGKYVRTTKKITDLGVYCVKATRLKDPKYTVITNKFEDQGSKLLWHCTGFELQSAIKNKIIKVNSLVGYYWKQNKRHTYSPFKAYVDFFYNRRMGTKDPIKNKAYKILLNSLYGKFIQTTKGTMLKYCVETEELKREIIAGGMYNPFIASLITGWCRTRIYELEKKYKSLHTSTDGIFTQVKPKEDNKLGGQKIENTGKLLLIRPRLYIHFKGKKYYKFALHGFRGKVEQLEEMYKNVKSGKTDKWEYEYYKFNKIKESLIQNKQVNIRVKDSAELNIQL